MAESNHKSGGGAATQGGINYQNRAAAWVCVRMLAERPAVPVGPESLPVYVRFETQEPTDDLLIGTADGSHSFVQAKRTLGLSSAPDSEFGSVVNQFVRQYLSLLKGSGPRPWNRPLDADRDRLVLITSTEASAPIRVHLAAALNRVRGLVAGQPLSDAATNQAGHDALAVLTGHMDRVWTDELHLEPTEADLIKILKLMYVTILDAETGGGAEVQTLDLLALAVVREQHQATAAWSRICQIVADLSQHRSGVNHAELRAMLQSTIHLKTTPSHEDDVEKLKKHSKVTHLEGLSKSGSGSPVPLHLGRQAIPSTPIYLPDTPQPSASIVDPTLSLGSLRFDANSKKLWHMPMAKSFFLPISEEDLDMKSERLGRLRRIEIPQAALAEALIDRPDLLMDSHVYEFLRDVWSHPKKYHSIIEGRPALRIWIDNIWASVPRGSKKLERRELQKFYRAMQSPEIDEQLLPDFTYEEISCWRIFMQAFPESISLLEAASSIKKLRHTQRMAIAALSATLAVTNDRRLSSRAAAIVCRLIRDTAVSTVHSYQEYQLVRHFLYASVEAGESPAESFLNFVNRHHPVKWELALNRGYYKDRTDATMALTIVRKIERPLNRDEWTRKITEYHCHLLPKKLIDEAYRKMRQPSLVLPQR